MFGPPVVDLCETKNNCTFYEKCRVLNDRASCEGEREHEHKHFIQDKRSL